MRDPATAASDEHEQQPPRGASLRVLVAHAQHGDQDAFRTIYQMLAPRLLNYLRALVGERDAEDVASETWGTIARDLTRYRASAGDFRAWATSIARYRAIDFLRRARPPLPLPDDQIPEARASDDTEADAHEAITTTAALAMIADLPHDQAQAVLLRVIMGLDATAAGLILHKRPGAVRTATHRGLRTLAARLATSYDATAPQDMAASER